MKHNPLFNFVGINLNIGALFLNIQEWLYNADINKAITLFISFLAIAWWLMKIYDQYLITRKRKRHDMDHRQRPWG